MLSVISMTVTMAGEVSDSADSSPAPLVEQARSAWSALVLPWSACRLAQQWSLGVIVLGYGVYLMTAVGWPRGEHALVGSLCGPDHPQWTEDVTYRRRTADGGYQKWDVTIPPSATWEYGAYVRGCPCKVKTCVRKCCPKYQMYQSSDNLTCTEGFRPGIFSNLENNVYSTKGMSGFHKENLTKAAVNQSDFKVVYGFADCGKYIGVFGARYEVVPGGATLLEDGTALTSSGDLLDIDDYCTDHFQDGGVVTIRCVTVRPLHRPRFWTLDRPHSHWLALVLSLASLAVLVFVFLFVPQLRNVHGALVGGVAVFSASYITQYLFDLDTLSPNFAYLWQFSCLGLFCWTTALGLDLWLFFCGDTAPRSPHRVAMYVGCSTALPALLTALTWMVGVVPDLSDSCPRPRFQDDPCTFTVERTSRLFLHLPVLVMIILNLVLYLSNSYNSNRVLQETSGKSFLLSPCGRHHETALQGLRLYSKVLMTLVVSGSCLLVLTAPSITDCVLVHHPLSLLHYYQGVLLLLLVIADRRVFKLLYASALEVHVNMQIRKQQRKEKKALKEKEEYAKYQQKSKSKESSA